MLDCTPKDVPFARNCRIERVKPGNRGCGVHSDVEAPRTGKPAEPAKKDVEHQQTKPEDGDASADQGNEPRDVIGPAVVTDGRKDAQGYADKRRIDHGK